MKRLHKAIISFGIVAVLASGSSVFAKSESARGRYISGAIVRIDRNTRTITVREQGGGKDTQVIVPAGSAVRTNQLGMRAAAFEQLHPGMFILDVRVR